MSADILIKIENLKKSFQGGLEALKGVNLEIQRGEILALLGPNGAGKTTLINAICGIVLPTSGSITVDGYDVVKDYRRTRSMIGLVPQELHLEAFEKVFQNVSYTRGLYGKKKDPAFIEKILSGFVDLCSKKRGEIKAELLAAKELNKNDIDKVKNELAENFGSNIKLIYKHDPSLIGGLVIKVGSNMVDSSIKNKLQLIEKQMIEA